MFYAEHIFIIPAPESMVFFANRKECHFLLVLQGFALLIGRIGHDIRGKNLLTNWFGLGFSKMFLSQMAYRPQQRPLTFINFVFSRLRPLFHWFSLRIVKGGHIILIILGDLN